MKMVSCWTVFACLLMAECMVDARKPYKEFEMNDEISDIAAFQDTEMIEKRNTGADICPCGWTSIGGGCYKFDSSLVTWDVARAKCQASGGDLLIISDNDNNNLLLKAARDHGVSDSWLGYFRPRYQSNTFLNVCGVKQEYMNWAKVEPNDSGGEESCVTMFTSGSESGKWNDLTCYRQRSYICEFKYHRCG